MGKKPHPDPGDGRCVATVRTTGQRCRNRSLYGVTVCNKHGGTLPSVRHKSAMARTAAERERRAIEPVPADDPEARGDIALAVEIRRTIAWIRFCEDAILDLGGHLPDADDTLRDVLGDMQLVSRETTSGVERGESTHLEVEKYAAGLNVWEERLRWNRQHLANLTKQWIAAGFEARRLELQQRTLDVLEKAIDGIVRDLGANPRDAAVRAIVSKRLGEAAEKPDSEQPPI